MVDDASRPTSQPRSVIANFSAWIDSTADSHNATFIRSGFIVLDANALLALYRIGSEARNQVLATFTSTGNRLWVPHQAVLEFSRNRKNAVVNRLAAFKEANSLVRTAVADAVEVLESAVEKVTELRDRNLTSRAWSPRDAGLDKEGLEAKLAGILDAAKTELTELESEHDLHPSQMQEVDSVLSRIDKLLNGKIGTPYGPDILRKLVEEAHDYRYPNRIPPGYLDQKEKETPLLAAGDYILWRQVIDKVQELGSHIRRVVLVTNDVKSDWWLFDKKERQRLGARPELVQEMRDTTQADLKLMTLPDFMESANDVFEEKVSTETVTQLKEALARVAQSTRSSEDEMHGGFNFTVLSYEAFENLVADLLVRMGYRIVDRARRGQSSGYDFVIEDSSIPEAGLIGVEVKHIRTLPTVHMPRIVASMKSNKFSKFIVICSGHFTKGAHRYAGAESLTLIDGEHLASLIDKYMNDEHL